MPSGVKVTGVSGLLRTFRRLAAEAGRPRPSVLVGYTQSYALWVHEDMEARHPNGQAKYLEEPFRRLTPELKAMIVGYVKQGKTVEQALLLAGLYLQAESQRLVPVDTGALRNSAFTRLES